MADRNPDRLADRNGDTVRRRSRADLPRWVTKHQAPDPREERTGIEGASGRLVLAPRHCARRRPWRNGRGHGGVSWERRERREQANPPSVHIGFETSWAWPLRIAGPSTSFIFSGDDYCHPPGPAKLFSFLLSCENSETRAGQQQRVTASERLPTCSCSPSPLAAEITLSRSPLPQSVLRSLSLTERHRRSSGRCVNFTSPRPRPRAVVSRRAAATTATLFILLPRTENRR